MVEGDLIVRDGRIAAIEPWTAGRSAETFDARGCFVLPGGVDPHTHALTNLSAVARSAAHGGTTTLQTFTLPLPGETPLAAFRRARVIGDADSAVDVAVHGSYFDPTGISAGLLAELSELGVCGVQIFLAFPELGLMFDDGQLYRVLRDAARARHPRAGAVRERGARRRAHRGARRVRRDLPARLSTRTPGRRRGRGRRRTIAIAALAGAPAYLVHLSTGIAIELTRAAKAAGAPLTVEVCTHHLLLDESAYERPDAEAFIVGPPLRPAADVEALWNAIADGTVDTRRLRPLASRGRRRSATGRPSWTPTWGCPEPSCACRSCSPRARGADCR